ncbi:hypothetical protein ACFL2Y_02495 [Candidatus Omnitrophota bacterium]
MAKCPKCEKELSFWKCCFLGAGILYNCTCKNCGSKSRLKFSSYLIWAVFLFACFGIATILIFYAFKANLLPHEQPNFIGFYYIVWALLLIYIGWHKIFKFKVV